MSRSDNLHLIVLFTLFPQDISIHVYIALFAHSHTTVRSSLCFHTMKIHFPQVRTCFFPHCLNSASPSTFYMKYICVRMYVDSNLDFIQLRKNVKCLSGSCFRKYSFCQQSCSKNQKMRLDIVVITRRWGGWQRQEGVCEFEARLVYITFQDS